MIKFMHLFTPTYLRTLVYMLQASEYHVGNYLKWYWQVEDFHKVQYRKQLQTTLKAKVLLITVWAVAILHFETLAWFAAEAASVWDWLLLVGGLLTIPIVAAHVLGVIVLIGNVIVQRPVENKIYHEAQQIFSQHPATIIAVAGSYGKTTMKELLGTVLAEGKTVAMSPGNMNTPSGLASFAKTLRGDEEIIVIEFGESNVGDITTLCKLVQPDFGVITGINPAHLSSFGSVDALASTIFEMVEYLGNKRVVANGESELVQQYGPQQFQLYSAKAVGGWKISKSKSDLKGTSFTMKKAKVTLRIESKLIGRHQIGPLAAVADAAIGLGLTKDQVESGLAKTKPFEHRFEPKTIGGATVIDDTYNGNIDGFRAGIAFAQQQKSFKRKIFVTPGLVDVGDKKVELHEEIGHLAAKVFDMIVLIRNSNTESIKSGLQSAGFAGEIIEQEDPLTFYNNLDDFVGAGDFVLLQNDLTDNYG